MDSFFALNRLSAYLDGDLPESEAMEVAAAIERDPELRAEYENLRRSINLLRRAGPAQAPPGFHARVMEQIHDQPHPNSFLTRLRRVFEWLPTEATALVAASVVVLMVVQARTDSSGGNGAGEHTATNESSVVENSEGLEDPDAVANHDRDAGPSDPENQAPAAASGETSSVTNGPTYLLIVSRNPELLTDLNAIASQVGEDAQLLVSNEDGTDTIELEPYTMTQRDNFERAILAVPSDARASVNEELESLGATRAPSAPPYVEIGPRASSTTSVFIIDLTYQDW